MGLLLLLPHFLLSNEKHLTISSSPKQNSDRGDEGARGGRSQNRNLVIVPFRSFIFHSHKASNSLNKKKFYKKKRNEGVRCENVPLHNFLNRFSIG